MKSKQSFLLCLPVLILIAFTLPESPVGAAEIPGASQSMAAPDATGRAVLPPGAFSKLTPSNRVTGVSVYPLLDWGASANATGYAYCIDTVIDNYCSTPISTGTVHQKMITTALSYSTTYEWQAVAVNASGVTYANGSQTAFWTFTTQAPPPGAFNKVNPPDHLTGVVTNPILDWQPSTGATEYWYCLDDVVNDDCDVVLVGPVINHQVQLSGLIPNHNYEWQVIAYNATASAYADGSRTAFWTFTTQAPLPGAFNKVNPTDGLTGVVTSPLLDWQESPGATEYWYCLDDLINDTCNGAWSGTGLNHQAQLSGLIPNHTYEWQVIAQNAGWETYANGSETAFWTFTTAVSPPGPFTKLSPANGSNGMPTTVTLDWSESTGAQYYQYCIDTSINNACNSSAGWTGVWGAHQVQLSGLSPSTQYEWQVIASNPQANIYADGSPTAYWTFTTQAPPPGAFNKLAPASGATGVTTNPVLDWGSSSGATEYSYCYDSLINNACNGSWISTGAAHQAQLNGLSNATPYEWQVRAVNGTGQTYANGSSTAYWSFTTGTSLLNTYLPLLFR